MNKKLFLLPVLVMGLSLGSCAQIDQFFSSIKEIEIVDYRNAYSVGQTFSEKNELLIYAKYSDGSIEELKYNQVSVNLINENKKYSAKDPFETAGTYTVTVSKGQTTSTPIEINVYASENYATSLEATTEKTSLKTMEFATIDISVSPSNYTVDLEYEIPEEGVYFKKTSSNTFEFYSEKAGEVPVTFKALKDANTYVSQTINFTVTAAAEKVEIAQSYKDLSTYYSPTVGDVNFLVVPVWFKDSSNYVSYSKRNNIIEDVRKAYFGAPLETGWHSVASFYKEESKGLFNLNGTVASTWYEAEYTIEQIGLDISDSSNNRTRKLIKNAVNWYFETYTEDQRTNYDSDGDGYLDGVVIIYGAPDHHSYGIEGSYTEYNNLWAYSSRITNSTASVTAPNVETFFWASYDFMYGYLEAVNRTGFKYHKGSTAQCRLDTHTYIHETGHVLGLDDYYDYTSQYNPAGGFSMEDYNVGGHDPYSIMSFGWVNPYIPTDSCRIKIGSFQSTHDLILLTPSWNAYNSPFDEYLLLELYTPDGLNGYDTRNQYAPVGAKYPKGPNSVGIRVWHVDARLTYLEGVATYSESLTTDGKDSTKRGLITAFSNTYIKDGTINSHCSKLCTNNKKYGDLNLLQLIRNNKDATDKNSSIFSGGDLFKTGDTFSMEQFGQQFPYKSTFGGTDYVLNSGVSLGWSFEVEITTKDFAIINLVRQ